MSLLQGLISWSEQEMIAGYRDGRDLDSPAPSENRSFSYRHGFQSGRDDLARKLSAPVADRLRMADEAISADTVTDNRDRNTAQRKAVTL